MYETGLDLKTGCSLQYATLQRACAGDLKEFGFHCIPDNLSVSTMPPEKPLELQPIPMSSVHKADPRLCLTVLPDFVMAF